MAIQHDIVAADNWFIGTDKTLRFEVFAEGGVAAAVMLDVSGFALRFRLAATVIGKDPFKEPGATVFTRQTDDVADPITVTGTFDAARATNTQRVIVPTLAADTDALSKGGTYVYALERIDADLEDVLAFGTATMKLPTTR